MRTHKEKKPFKCTECPKSFERVNMLRDHMRTHTGEKPFRCSECSRSFAQRGALQNHVKRIHSNRLADVENVESNHNGHRTSSQVEDRPFECPECSKKYRFSSDLKLHRKIHDTVTRTYNCTECGKTFKQPNNLLQHMKIHRKPSLCSVCGKQVRNLQQHMVIHSGEKPYSCSACEQSYFRLIQLRRHNKKYHDSKTSDKGDPP
jgi:uncharacterized Zn-finger protein